MQLWQLLATAAVLIVFGFGGYGLNLLLDKLDPIPESERKEEHDEEIH